MYETYLKIDIKIDAANDIRTSFSNFDNNLKSTRGKLKCSKT